MLSTTHLFYYSFNPQIKGTSTTELDIVNTILGGYAMLSATIAVASLVVHALLKQMFKHRKPVIFTKKKVHHDDENSVVHQPSTCSDYYILATIKMLASCTLPWTKSVSSELGT